MPTCRKPFGRAVYGVLGIPKEIHRLATLFLLRERPQLQRFWQLSKQYTDLCRDLDPCGNQTRYYACGENGYNWQWNTKEIKRAFSEKVPLAFLRQPTIAHTMVHRGDYETTRERIDFLLSVWPSAKTARVLREDYIGLPTIIDTKYATSTNRSHHAYHLAYYEHKTKKLPESWSTVVEWGGGYGNMARLVRRLNRECTYTIIDLPELSALQYIYLFSLLGDEVNLVIPGKAQPMDGKINIVTVGAVMSGETTVAAQTFVSTWALTESPRAAQMFIFESNFLGADNILMAYSSDSKNHLLGLLPKSTSIIVPVPVLLNEHYYAFR